MWWCNECSSKFSFTSISFNKFCFSFIALLYLFSKFFDFFIILADWWPICPLSGFTPDTFTPFFVFSILSDQILLCFAAFFNRLISFFNLSFWLISNWSLIILFSYHDVKFPDWTSIVFLLIEIIWLIHPSKKSLSWDISKNPFLFFRYLLTIFLPSISKWFVGSSISKNPFSFVNKIAKRIFACSPLDRVSNSLWIRFSSTFNKLSSLNNLHSSSLDVSSLNNSIPDFEVSVIFGGNLIKSVLLLIFPW